MIVMAKTSRLDDPHLPLNSNKCDTTSCDGDHHSTMFAQWCDRRSALLVVSVCAPVVMVLTLITVNAVSALNQYIDYTSIDEHLASATVVGQLITALQQERGVTCMWLTSPLAERRRRLDEQLLQRRQRSNAWMNKCDKTQALSCNHLRDEVSVLRGHAQLSADVITTGECNATVLK